MAKACCSQYRFFVGYLCYLLVRLSKWLHLHQADPLSRSQKLWTGLRDSTEMANVNSNHANNEQSVRELHVSLLEDLLCLLSIRPINMKVRTVFTLTFKRWPFLLNQLPKTHHDDTTTHWTHSHGSFDRPEMWSNRIEGTPTPRTAVNELPSTAETESSSYGLLPLHPSPAALHLNWFTSTQSTDVSREQINPHTSINMEICFTAHHSN